METRIRQKGWLVYFPEQMQTNSKDETSLVDGTDQRKQVGKKSTANITSLNCYFLKNLLCKRSEVGGKNMKRASIFDKTSSSLILIIIIRNVTPKGAIIIFLSSGR